MYSGHSRPDSYESKVSVFFHLMIPSRSLPLTNIAPKYVTVLLPFMYFNPAAEASSETLCSTLQVTVLLCPETGREVILPLHSEDIYGSHRHQAPLYLRNKS